jgi:hypothetical protein
MTTQTISPIVESSDEGVSQDLKRIMRRAEVKYLCLRAEAHRRTSTSARTNRFRCSTGRSHFGWTGIQSLHRPGILLSFTVGSHTPSRIMGM